MKATALTLKVSLGIIIVSIFSACGSNEQASSSTSPTSPPNILFCIADDATWKHMSAYGTDWVQTPAFDRVAKQGLLFSNAYTPNAKCAPSRSIILTGRNSWQLEEAANHLPYFPPKFKTYAEALSDVGYKVGYTGKGWAPGTAKTEDGEERELLVKAFNDIRFDSTPTTGISKTDYVGNFKVFLDSLETDQPFSFWYGGYEPHRRYEYGSGVKYGGKKISDIPDVFDYWPDVDSVRNDLLDYAFEIEYFDKQLSQMLDILEERGELENTLVVVTSDNGMPFPRAKGQQYEHSHHLPLAIMWLDGIKKPGRKISEYISFTDFAATFIEAAGHTAEELGMHPMEGRSLMPFFTSEGDDDINHRDFMLLGKERHDVGRPNDWGYPIRGILDGKYLYLKNYKPDRWPAGHPVTGYTNTDGSPTKTYILNLRRDGVDTLFWELNFGKRPMEELYDIAEDEDCIVNLADDPEYQEIKERLKERMVAELKNQEDPRVLGNGDIFDSYEPDRDKNFYEDYINGVDIKASWINKSDYEKVDSIKRGQ